MLTDSLPVNIGRYEIKSLIGRGGMGDLYLARDPNTNRLVALKLLNASLHSGDLRERFAREARALAALNHPNIVTIYDYGEYQGSPFIVMEYVRGETLAEKIKRRAPLATQQKLKLMAELCAGLAHAHDAGIIHRDIKPANLMVEQQDRLKILDFGIARVTEGSMTRVGMQMTQLNMRIGTPGYMSPEQIEGNDIDHRSDLFAVGTVFYELLAYREAFTGGSTRQIENKVLEARPTPLDSLVRGIDPEVVALVARALAKDPRDRFQDAAEFEQALEHQRWRLGPTKKTPSPPGRPTPPPTPAPGGPGRGSRDARADAAYQRSIAVFQDGAEDAARRFAIEALAEDPNHLGARALLEQLDPHPYISATQQVGSPAIEPTLVMSQPSSSPTAVQSRDSTGSSLWRSVVPLWKRYRVPAGIAAASVLVVAGLAFAIISATNWFASSSSLIVIRPTGGMLIGPGISCGTFGSDCQENASSGETIELQAQPDPGYAFGGYTGDCANGRAIMTTARTCGATFNPGQAPPPATMRVLTITPSKGGTIVGLGITCGTLGPECTTNHPDGTQVKLDVLADQGFLFSRYTGACAPDGQTVMTEARTCGATFVASQVANQQASGGGGGGGALPSRNRRTAPPPDAPPSLPSLPSPPIGGGGVAGGGGSAGAGTVTGAGAAGEGVAAPGTRATANVPPIGSLITPTAPTPPDVTAKSQIQDVLTRSCAAYDQLELEALKRIYPNAPNVLRDQFRQYKTMQCTFTGPPEYEQLDAINGTAKLQVGVKQAYDLKIGGEKTSNVTAFLTLSRPEPRGPWFIEAAQIKPKK